MLANRSRNKSSERWAQARFGSELLHKVETGSIRFEGGDGGSTETAVVIVGADDGREGVAAEYFFLSRKHGPQGRDWNLVDQTLLDRGDRQFDELRVHVDGEWGTRRYYFDITDFWAKDLEIINRKLRERGA